VHEITQCTAQRKLDVTGVGEESVRKVVHGSGESGSDAEGLRIAWSRAAQRSGAIAIMMSP
jgi:hypothetical protein